MIINDNDLKKYLKIELFKKIIVMLILKYFYTIMKYLKFF